MPNNIVINASPACSDFIKDYSEIPHHMSCHATPSHLIWIIGAASRGTISQSRLDIDDGNWRLTRHPWIHDTTCHAKIHSRHYKNLPLKNKIKLYIHIIIWLRSSYLCLLHRTTILGIQHLKMIWGPMRCCQLCLRDETRAIYFQKCLMILNDERGERRRRIYSYFQAT